MAQKFRNFTFTHYGKEPIFTEWNMNYLAYQPELCPTTKRQHLQGFICMKNQHTKKQMMKVIGSCHIEIIRGSLTQNLEYCSKIESKNGEFKQFGTLPIQGKRNDMTKIKDEIMKGKSTDDIVIENPMMYHQYGRTLTKIEDIYMRKQYRTEMTTCEWIYGKTGVGKSHKAFDGFTPETHYVWKNDHGWQDGYKQQNIVIINDFRGEIPYNELLQLIDKYPHSINRRGREPMPFTSKHIIITSSLAPEKIYKHRDNEDSLEQLMRRITLTRLKAKQTSQN